MLDTLHKNNFETAVADVPKIIDDAKDAFLDANGIKNGDEYLILYHYME